MDAASIMCQLDADNDKRLSVDEFVKAATTCHLVMDILKGVKWWTNSVRGRLTVNTYRLLVALLLYTLWHMPVVRNSRIMPFSDTIIIA